MEPVTETAHNFMPDGFLVWALLWVWLGAIVLHGLAGSFFRPEPDPIRPSGPIEGWSKLVNAKSRIVSSRDIP